ncbi:MAG: GntR family transcriptional regulator, partial [Atopobiaceae bacterium]|nr:GntR family transcriptional regulator [Atopobiaceae bacterium]
MSDSAHNNLRSLAFLPRHTDEPARDWAWRILLHNICMARLLPGNIINTAELARIMGLSRTPIHEACVMIEDRGLVERIDRSKTVISLINMDEVRQYCFILTTVEPWIYSSASQEQWTAHATSLIKTIADIRSARLHHEGAAELLRLSQRYRYTCYQAAGMDDCWNMLRSASLAYI